MSLKVNKWLFLLSETLRLILFLLTKYTISLILSSILSSIPSSISSILLAILGYRLINLIKSLVELRYVTEYTGKSSVTRILALKSLGIENQ